MGDDVADTQSVSNDLLAEFYIPATSSLFERRPRTLKHGDTFAMFDHYGDLFAGPHSPEGIFHQDTRFLSRFVLTIGGERPLLLSSTVQNNNAVLHVDLRNADLFDSDAVLLPKNTIHVSRAKFLLDSVCHERLAVRNYGDRRCRVSIALDYDADFADMFEIRGHRRERHGARSSEVLDAASVRFVYAGLDGVARSTRITFDPPPVRVTVNRAEFELELDPKARCVLLVTVGCVVGQEAPPAADGFFTAMRRARRSIFNACARAAAVETSNSVFNEVLCRSMADFNMLLTDTPHGPYPYAGIPWFCTAFGRDGIIAALEMLWVDPEVARGVLRFLAAHQAQTEDPQADAEPGKILHEVRECEMARRGEVPFGRYYGSVDSTPLFVVLAGLYWKRSGDRETLKTIWAEVKAALTWIDRYGDRDGDGFLEYAGRRPSGLRNQGWKDSKDAVFHQDGQLASPPIALVEVQGYVYLAKKLAANLALIMGEPVLAATLEEQARHLREQFEQRFWCPDLQFYALALDAEKQPCRVRTSNAGHLLFSGIVAPERGVQTAKALLHPDFFSGWGIRTVSLRESRFNPMSYHNGSIWPHDNALIGLGLARYGCLDEVLRLTTALFDVAAYMDLRRLPELFCGFRRHRDNGPTLYPVACAPQAWAAAAPFALLEACLGLEFEAISDTVQLRHPRLPDFLDWVRIRGLRLRESHFDILLRRHGADVTVNVLERDGPAHFEVAL
ncbi:MAG TPA: amylo-alpha-1,6-glucosidase [Nitrospirales bacterium]|jgi:glycogen debranching enzyme|nr:amylo-alpha-1,6-glucosidase [Nitrospirales bacterium]